MPRRSMFDGSGYFFNDDRCSGGAIVEDDTLACTHCQAGLTKRVWEEQGGWKCYQCDKPLCARCGSAPPSLKCDGPYEAKLQRAIDEDYRRRQNSIILGT